MKVTMIMKPVAILPPQTTVQEAAKVMKEDGVAVIPVGKPGDIIGVVTPRQIVLSAVAEGGKADVMPIDEITNTVIGFCRDEEETDAVLAAMQANGLEHMLVQNIQGDIVGCVSLPEILHASEDTPQAA